MLFIYRINIFYGGAKVDGVKKVLDIIAKIVKGFLGILLGIMLIVALVEVFRRYFLGRSFAWSEELIRYLIIWISFLGAAVAYKEQSLVFFDMIVDRIKGKNKFVLFLITNTVSLVFVAFVFINSLATINMPSIANQNSIGLQISMVIPFMAAPIGLGLMLIFGLYHYRVIIDTYKDGGYK